ncbi:hypothetical protein PFDG_05355 [Plasmodium falciparum Dd2]|uniref:Uncharacterized protein n=1 Tax=Plasmodium falciparum (isolate Dd2) TaxID=57267 RepID=A0A0L7MAF7_PLAF4|nr:hypothetical protein PFDG_05355 [Plasmodium falciparum Dd2]
MFFITIIRDSNICNQFVKQPIDTNKTFLNLVQAKNSVDHVLINEKKDSNMCATNKEIDTSKLLLPKYGRKNLFTKGEEANIVSNANNNKGINNL